MPNNLFFKPFKGSLYETEGFLGHKILVLGASFYCGKRNCPFFSKCTDRIIKDSSAVDRLCPIYNSDLLVDDTMDEQSIITQLSSADESLITKLSDAPELEIESGGKVYKKFGNLLSRHYFEGKLTWSSIWQRLSFTNYVQYVLPEWQTEKEDLTERDLKAFHMALESTKAEIVIIWGCVVNKPIQALAIDRHTLQETSGYLFQIEYGGKTIPVVNPYHPASPHCFYRQSKENFFDALNKAMSGQPY